MALSPPPGILKQRSDPCLDKSCLDTILGKQRSLFGEKHCFDLAGPYRGNPRFDPSVPPSLKREGGPVRSSLLPPLPLVKSHSVPEFYGGEAASPAPAPAAVKNTWQCLNPDCKTTDISCLGDGPDSTLSCKKCGTEAEGVAKIDLERPSNCPKEEDNQQVNDGIMQTAEQAAYAAMLSGPESSDEKRRREQLHQGGTRMPTRKLRQHGLLQAQNCIDTQAQRDAKEAMQENGPDKGKRCSIIRCLEQIFDEIPSLDGRIAKYMRLEAIRIYSMSMRHEKLCSSHGCTFALSQKSSMMIAHAIIEHVLTSLLENPDGIKLGEGNSSPVTTIASLAPERTHQDVQKMFKDFAQLQVRFPRGMPRMQVLSAISIISDWDAGYEEFVCVETDNPPMPPSLRLPPSVADAPPEYGRVGTTVDPSDNTIKLRNELWAAAQASVARSDVRIAALEQLAEPQVVAFVTEAQLPLEVVALSMVAATSQRMAQGDPTTTLMRCVSKRHQLASSTITRFIEELAPLLKPPEPPPQAATINDQIWGSGGERAARPTTA